MHLELVVLGRPVLFPVIDAQLPVEPDLDVEIRVGLELVIAGDGRDDLSGRAGRPVRVREIQTGHRLERAEVAELRERRVVPEDPVAAARDQERNPDDGVACQRSRS